MLIQHKELGISEKDVKKCEDTSVLLEWKLKIDCDIKNIKSQMEQYRKGTGKVVRSKDWYEKTKSIASLYGILSQMIQNRITALRKINHEKRNSSYERMFFQNLVTRYPNIYNEIHEEVKAILSV